MSLVPPLKRPSSNLLDSASKRPRTDLMHDSEMDLINRQEYVRLLEQALVQLGYEDAAKTLEKQSGIPLQPKPVEDLRKAVLEGDWDCALTCLESLSLEDPAPPRFLLLEHKFIETLARGDLPAAIQCLRLELTSLASRAAKAAEGPSQPMLQRVQQLATCLLLPSAAALRAVTGWAGPEGGSRERALQDLRALLPPHVMLPDRRLEVLLSQALELQLQRCTFFNSSRQVSLLADLSASRDDMPTEVLAVLADHRDEVWFAEFSGDGRLLATASRDRTVIIYHMRGPADFVKLHTLVHDAAVSFMAFEPNSARLITTSHHAPSNQQAMLLWDAESGALLRKFEMSKGSDASRTATAPDTATQGPYVAWLAPGRHFVSGPHGDRHNWLLITDADTGAELFRLRCAARPHDFAASRCGRFLVACCADKKLRVWDLTTHQELSFGGGETMMTVVLSSRVGDHLLVAFQSQKVEQWDLSHTFRRAAEDASNAAAHQNGALGPAPLLPAVAPPTAAPRVSTVGAAGAGAAGTAAAADAAALGPAPSQPVRVLKGLPERAARYILRPAFFGFRQSFIAMGSEDSLIYVWNRATGDLLDTLEGHTGTVNSVAAHPTEPGLLVSASDDKTVHIWGCSRLAQQARASLRANEASAME